ncbi:hypothetical protein FA13DRAFT_1798096 [Coprinellus micaceus]|uniref:Uncharacterized protein n=1 Tax=Coprinellus micaceus TaxID=71717 RepID=A0A4Y7SNP6_COPMI|nr:hypothetical protein FA13DRAFT_1798096 [Coprinellus micaceus]
MERIFVHSGGSANGTVGGGRSEEGGRAQPIVVPDGRHPGDRQGRIPSLDTRVFPLKTKVVLRASATVTPIDVAGVVTMNTTSTATMLYALLPSDTPSPSACSQGSLIFDAEIDPFVTTPSHHWRSVPLPTSTASTAVTAPRRLPLLHAHRSLWIHANPGPARLSGSGMYGGAWAEPRKRSPASPARGTNAS